MSDESRDREEIETLERIEQIELAKRQQDFEFRQHQMEMMNETMEKIPEIVGETMKQLLPILSQMQKQQQLNPLWSPPDGKRQKQRGSDSPRGKPNQNPSVRGKPEPEIRGKPDMQPPMPKADGGESKANEPSGSVKEQARKVRENLGIETEDTEGNPEENDTGDWSE